MRTDDRTTPGRRKGAARLAALAAVWCVSAAISARAQDGAVPGEGTPGAERPASGRRFSVDDVTVEGNTRIDTAAIRLQLRKTRGEVSADEVSEDIKALYQTGFFDQVSASVSEGPRTILTYTVVEKPVVRKVFVRGNDAVKESELADVLSFGAKRFLDRQKLESLDRAAESFYQTRGYYDASVKHAVVPVEDNQVDVTFTVDEGDRYKIDLIEVRGLSAVDESDLVAAIATKRYKWWNSWLLGTGRVNKEQLENDRVLIRQYFLDHGYVDASVSEPRIEKRGDGRLRIVFDAEEGPLYKIGAVTATGDLVDGDVRATLEDTKAAPGEVFKASEIREDTFLVSEKFGNEGYAFANVVPETRVDREKATVDVEYRIEKGQKATVERINVRGNEKTYDNVIRRELKLAEKDVYSAKRVKRSEALLKRLGYFEEAGISTEPGATPGTVDLNVNVREASTGTFTAGAGYSTSDGALFNARISENNVFGTGRKIDLNLEYGSQRDNFILSYLDPRFGDSALSVGVDALMSEREFFDFDRRLAGGGATLGYPLEAVFGEELQDVSTSLRYELIDVEIANVDRGSAAPLVIASEGKTTSSSLTPQLTRNTIDNPLNPSVGSKQVVSLELAGAGGDQEFYLLEARNQWYQPLVDTPFGPLVYAMRTTLGYGDTYGGSDVFPLFKRYFPGGINTVRGYENRSLGPVDENGNQFGGSKQLINNAEVIFPLVNSAGLRGVVFFDAGEAFDDERSIRLGDLRLAYGAGLRWSSPLGPIRIEFGFPIDKKENEQSVVTMFAFGAPL